MPPDLRAKQSSTLSDLPIELWSQLARHSAPRSDAQGHPLLRVARCGRDAVLRSLARVSLDLNSQGEQADSAIRSIAVLLDRACRAAPTGLNVELALGQHGNDLPDLLRPAVDSPEGGAWQNVHTLRIGPRRYCSRYATYKEPPTAGILAVIPPAFPNLKHLHIRHLHLHLGGAQLGGKGGLLDCLRSHPTLTSLHLVNYIMQPDAVQQAASDLASLPYLVELELAQAYEDKATNPADLVSQLTGLTRLSLDSSLASKEPMFQAAAHIPSLQSLDIDHHRGPSASHVQQVLLACKQLTHLSFGAFRALNQEVVDVLVAYGGHVRSLTAGELLTESSMVGQHWGITDLHLFEPAASNLHHLARLPLHTVTTLELYRTYHFGLSFLELPWNGGMDGVPEELRQAAINLAACPAWQRNPASKLGLFGDPAWSRHLNLYDEEVNDNDELVPPEDSFTQEQALALFEALAPLGGPHVEEVELCVDSPCFDLGQAEVETLGRSVRGGHASMVTTLTLFYCSLGASFWASLDIAFPALSTLDIGFGSSCDRLDLTTYCKKKAAALTAESPFKLTLTPALYESHDGDLLQASFTAQGSPHISVVRGQEGNMHVFPSV